MISRGSELSNERLGGSYLTSAFSLEAAEACPNIFERDRGQMLCAENSVVCHFPGLEDAMVIRS